MGLGREEVRKEAGGREEGRGEMEEEERQEGKKAGIGSVLCTLNVDRGMQMTTIATETRFPLLEPSVALSFPGRPQAAALQRCPPIN